MKLVHRPSGPLHLHLEIPSANLRSLHICNSKCRGFLVLGNPHCRCGQKLPKARVRLTRYIPNLSSLPICLSLVARARHGPFSSTTALSSKGGTMGSQITR